MYKHRKSKSGDWLTRKAGALISLESKRSWISQCDAAVNMIEYTWIWQNEKNAHWGLSFLHNFFIPPLPVKSIRSFICGRDCDEWQIDIGDLECSKQLAWCRLVHCNGQGGQYRTPLWSTEWHLVLWDHIIETLHWVYDTLGSLWQSIFWRTKNLQHGVDVE